MGDSGFEEDESPSKRRRVDEEQIPVEGEEPVPAIITSLKWSGSRLQQVLEKVREMDATQRWYVQELELSKVPIIDSIFKRDFREFPNLQRLVVSFNDRINDETVSSFVELFPNLVSLDVSFTSITDNSLITIHKFTQLRELFIKQTVTGDVGIQQLVKSGEIASQILTLDVSKTNISHQGFQMISKFFTSLENLMVAGNEHLEDLDILGLDLPKLKRLDLSYAHIGDEATIHICSSSPELEELRLAHYTKHKKNNITNKGLGAIGSHLKKLRILDIQELKIDDAGLESLVPLADTLEVLTLSKIPVTSKGMVHLAKLVNLKKLWIVGGVEFIEIDDEGVVSLQPLNKLEDLNLTNTRIADASLKSIGESFPLLQKLYLHDVKITDAGLSHLAPLKNLQVLQLGGYRKDLAFTDQGIKNLLPLADNLIELDIGGNPLSDSSVEVFVQFKKLCVLDILNTKITAKGTKEIAKHLPGCKIK